MPWLARLLSHLVKPTFRFTVNIYLIIIFELASHQQNAISSQELKNVEFFSTNNIQQYECFFFVSSTKMIHFSLGCIVGYGLNSSGLCEVCGVDTYSDSHGNQSCISCPIGAHTQNQSAQTSCGRWLFLLSRIATDTFMHRTTHFNVVILYFLYMPKHPNINTQK